MTVLTGVVWPLAVTAVAQVAAPGPAKGSLVHGPDGAPIAAAHVGQAWTDPGHLWGRPSATATPYDASASSGSNLGPSNPALREAVAARVEALGGRAPVPVDLVTTSASGLDPEITPAGAAWQVARIAAARGVAPEVVEGVIAAHTSGRLLGIVGEPRVDVLGVNLALDAVGR